MLIENKVVSELGIGERECIQKGHNSLITRQNKV
jgi:hypothetical protein